MDILTNAPSDEDLVDIVEAEEERAKQIEDQVAVDAGEAPAAEVPSMPAISDEDIVDIAIEDEQKAQRIETGIAVEQNKAIKPEDQARALRIAEREGLPVDVVRRNLDQFDETPVNVDQMQTDTPSLAKLATTPYGPITQYDIETMGWLERFFRATGQSFESGVEGLEASDIGYKWRGGMATPEDIARLKELRDAQKQNVDYRLGVAGDFLQYPVQSAPATAATVLRSWDEVLIGGATGVAAGAFTGPGAVAGGVTGAGIGARVGIVKGTFEQLAGDAYVDAMFSVDETGKPLDEDTAYAISTFAGGVGAVAELLPFEKALDTMPFLKGVVGKEGARQLVGFAAQNPAVRASLARMGRILKVGGANAFAEVIQEATKLESIIAAGGVTDEDGNVLADQRGERYGEALYGGFAGGTTLGAAGEAVTATVDKVASVRAKRAEAKQQALVELGDKIRTSKVNSISPETVVAHAKQMDADGAAPQMSAPAEALVKLFQSEGLTAEQVQEQFPTLSQALDEAAQTGAEVTLNAETVVKLARLEKFAEITADIRTSPGELTANEAKQADVEFNQMLESMSDEDIAKAVNASVHKDVMNQLVAAGTDPKVAETQAKLFTSVISNLAERTGMQPDQLLKRYGLTITGDESVDTAAAADTTMMQRDPAYGEPAIKINGQVLKASDFFPNWEKGSRPAGGEGMSIADEQAMGDVDLGPGMPEDPFWGHIDLLYKAREIFGRDVVDAAIESDPEAGFGMANAAGDFQSLKASARSDAPDPQDPNTLYQSEQSAEQPAAEATPAADATPAGGLTDKGLITVDTLRDAIVIPIFADLTDAGRVFNQLDGLPLTPTRYFGGPNFPWLKQYRDAGIVWAFNKQQVISKLRNHVRNIQDKAKAERRLNQRVVITVLAMKDDAHTSNEMTINALLRTLDAVVAAGRFPASVLDEAKAFIVGQHKKKEDGYKELKTFPGFGDAQKLHDWIRGATFTGRKALAKEMQSAKFEQFPGMFPVSRVIREAVDPDYRATQVGDALLAFEIDPDDPNLLVDFDDPATKAAGIERHPSYRYGMRGKLLGSFKTHTPMEVLYKDLLPKVIARSNPGSAPKFLMERLSNGGKLSAKGTGTKTDFKLPMNNVTAQTLSVTVTVKDKATGKEQTIDPGEYTVEFEEYTSAKGDDKEAYFLKFKQPPPKGASILATNEPDGQLITQDVIDHANVIEGLHDYRIAQAMTAALAGSWRTNDIDGTKGGVIPVEFERALAENEAAVTLTKYTRDDVKKGKQDGSLRVFQLGTAKVEEGGLSTWFAIKKGLDYRQEYPSDVTDRLVADGILTDNETALVGVANNELGVRGMLTFQVLKAIEEGVTVLDCFKVKSPSKPFGLLPTLYGTMGFEEVGAIPFDPQYFDAQQLADLKAVWSRQGWNEADGYPEVAIMKYRGSDAVRSEATRRFIAEGQSGLGLLDDAVGPFKAARDGLSQSAAADDGRGGRAGEGDGRADPRRFRDRAGGLAGEGRTYVRNVLAADQRATDALKLPPDLIDRIRERFPDLDPAKAPSPGPSSSGETTLYQSDLSFYDPSLKPLIKDRDVKASAIRTVDQLVQIADGMKSWRDWYARYEQVLVDFLGSPEEAQLFQDILSATSQAASVKANVGLAIKAYDQMKGGQPFDGYLPAVIKNLERIREKQAVQGRKIGQYGEASNGNTDAIAVDRHIAMVIFGVKAPSPRQIEEAKGMIREIAQRLGWAPREVQAALWAGNQILLGTPEEKIGSYDDVLLKKGEPLKQLFRDIQSRNGVVRGTGGSQAPVGAAAGGATEGQTAEGQQRLEQRAQSTTTFARGSISFTPARDKFKITLTGKADLSTFMHESAHYFLEVLQDLVEKGDAPRQIMEDLGVIRRWAGVPMGGKIERVHHEKFARGFEAYLMEGRAPSTDLQSVFNRFRAWLVFIYKKLTALNVELTDDVRGVMDRLVASDREIAEARTNVGWSKPLPKEALYLSDDEYDRYVEAWNKANEAQQREVDAALMLEAAREAQEAWKAERKKVFDEEKAKLAQTRGYRAWKLLSEGEGLQDVRPGWSNIKIDPATVPSEWRRDAAGMTAPATESGLPLEAVAEILGFKSGEEMLSTIAAAKFANRELPRQVQKIMDERHGALDMTALADLAMQAVHSDKTQEVLLTEFRAMASRARIGAAPVGMTKWMAAQAEQRLLGLTRRQLDPTRWRRAELKAATDSAKAAAKGDVTKAAVHKRQQMMAAAMYRATVDAQKRIETIRKKLLPFTKNDRRAKLGKAGDLYLDGIDEILEGIQLKQMSAKSVMKLDRLAKLVEEADKNGEPLVLPDKLRAMLGKKNFADMTLEELEGVHDSVMNIWHLAKTKNELKARQERRQLDQVLQEAAANAAASLGTKEAKVNLTEGWKDGVGQWGSSFRAALTKMEFILGWLDGKPDGGLLHRLIFQPIADAQKAKFNLMQRFYQSIIVHMRKLPADQRARWASKRTFLGNSTANGATIISAALNLGNEGNKKKLLQGAGVSEQQLMSEINAFMTKADWDFVQHIWNEIDTLWPQIEATTKAATGLPPEKVVPSPIVTPFGTYAGGYYPVVYDTRPRSDVDFALTERMRARQENNDPFTNSYMNPALGDGFTKARVDMVKNPPLLLDLKVISMHLSEVVHYVTHYEAVTQAWKIIRDPRFSKIVTETMGHEFYKPMKEWLTDVAQDQDAPAVTKREPVANAAAWIRGGVTIANMAYNIFTGFKQLLGVISSVDAVGLRYMAVGIQKTWLSPNAIANWKEAFKKSAELEPLLREFDRDIRRINDIYMKNPAVNAVEATSAAGFMHIGWLQAFVNQATWWGAYSQWRDKGFTDQEAVDHADATIRMTQGGGSPKDLAPIQRSSEMNKFLTMHYTWFSVLFNRLDDVNRTTRSVRDVPKAMRRAFVLVMATVMVEELLGQAYEEVFDRVEGDDEDDAWVQGFLLTSLMKSADTAIATIPLLRAAVSVEYAAGDGFKPTMSPAVRFFEDIPRVGAAIRDFTLEGELPSRSEGKAIARAVTTATHVPVSGLYNLIDEFFGEAIFDEKRKN